jgi:hypothetical protein
VNRSVLFARTAVLFFICIFLADGDLWAAETPTKSRKRTRPGSSSSEIREPGREAARARKRDGRKRKRSDVKPMPPLADAPFSSEVPLLPMIREAKARLAGEKVGYFPAQGGKPARRELKLALADFETGKLRIVKGVEQNKELVLSATDVRYDLNWWNGFNSSIDVLEPPKTGIVALLYALDPKRKDGLRRNAVIYTPYSNALLQQELVEAGRRYLSQKIAEARLELRHVMSRSESGAPLHEEVVFTDEDYFNLILAEHMDPEAFRSITDERADLDPEQEARLVRLARRILVIIGANQEDAYRFTGNYASARGLTQFTPVGMKVVWNRYTEADISRDFLEATADHLNAIKAEICLLDHYLASMSSAYPALSGSRAGKYAAGACYNGGPRNVLYGLRNFGMKWLNPQRRLSALSRKDALTQRERRELEWLKRFRNHETFIYLNKIHEIERIQPKLGWPQPPVESADEAEPDGQVAESERIAIGVR